MQVNDPSVLVHVAGDTQSCLIVVDVHSLTSEKYTDFKIDNKE